MDTQDQNQNIDPTAQDQSTAPDNSSAFSDPSQTDSSNTQDGSTASSSSVSASTDNMPTILNDMQIRSVIDQLVAQGAPRDFIQSTVDEYQNNGDGTYSLKQEFLDAQNKRNQASADPNAGYNKVTNTAGDIGEGIIKGGLSTLKGVAEIGQKIGNFVTDPFMPKGTPKLEDPLITPGTDQNTAANDFLAPTDTAQSIGKGGEQIGEFFIPAGAVNEVEKTLAGGVNIAEKLAPKVGPHIANILEALSKTGVKMAVRAVEGGGVVAIQSGGDPDQTKTAAEVGGAIPAATDAAKGIKTALKPLAPRIINSMIKPLLKDFSYGKNPGRAISEMGITAKSLPELASKVSTARDEIGQKLGNIYQKASNVLNDGKNISIDLTPEISKIEIAIKKAASGGKENQDVVTRLTNMKDALLHEHTVTADGDIVRTSSQPKDLSSLNPKQAFEFKKQIGSLTRFTGNPSDDKAVNSVFKQIYGAVKDKLNTAVEKVDPSIAKLNEQYADLTSAKIATEYRDKIEQRQNLVSLPQHILGVGSAITTAIASGGSIIPSLLAGLGGATMEKALATPIVKTNIAKWLMESSPEEKQKLFDAVPAFRGALIKVFSGGSS